MKVAFPLGCRRVLRSPEMCGEAKMKKDAQNRTRKTMTSNPCFFSKISLPFVLFQFSLLVLCVFPFFSMDFRGSAKRKKKKQGLEGHGKWSGFNEPLPPDIWWSGFSPTTRAERPRPSFLHSCSSASQPRRCQPGDLRKELSTPDGLPQGPEFRGLSGM